MLRWLRISAFAVLAFGVVSYVVDFAVYRVTGSPRGKFTVSHFVSAPLKNNKQEIDFTGKEDVPCSITIYPQDGFVPCWSLRRHTNQVSTY